MTAGLDTSELGVICPFRAQVPLLQVALLAAQTTGTSSSSSSGSGSGSGSGVAAVGTIPSASTLTVTDCNAANIDDNAMNMEEFYGTGTTTNTTNTAATTSTNGTKGGGGGAYEGSLNLKAQKVGQGDRGSPAAANIASSVEVSTVDRFQGRDKSCVIVSTVRSSGGSGSGSSTNAVNAGDLLRDWRRVNVAVTRARHKLVIVGSLRVMRQVPVLSALADLMEERQWVVRLPANGHTHY